MTTGIETTTTTNMNVACGKRYSKKLKSNWPMRKLDIGRLSNSVGTLVKLFHEF